MTEVEPRYMMEDDATIKNTILGIRKHYVQHVHEIKRTALSVVQKPIVMWAGSDVKHASIHIPNTYGLFIQTDNLKQIGMVKLTTDGIVANAFEYTTSTKNPFVFIRDKYEDEWLDRLKLFYQMSKGRGAKNPELRSISELYTGPLDSSNLKIKAEKMRPIELDPSLSEDDIHQANVKLLTERAESEISGKMEQLQFLIWLLTTLPIHAISDHNISPNLLKRAKMGSVLMPQDEEVIIKFLEVADSSINQFSKLNGFQNIEIPIHIPGTGDSYLEPLNRNIAKISEKIDGHEKEIKNLNKQIEELESEEVVDKNALKLILSKKEDIEGKISQLSLYLKYNAEYTIKGSSAFNIFVFDEDDVNVRVASPDICQIISVTRPNRAMRKALVFQAFQSMYNTYIAEGISLRMAGGIEQTIVDAMAGLNSIQIEQAVKISVQNKALLTDLKKTNKIVELTSFDFESVRKSLVKKEYLKLEDESLTFDDVAGQDHVKESLMADLIMPSQKLHTISLIPQGFAFLGRPGVGKSHIIKAIRGEMIKRHGRAYLIVHLDVGALKKGIVGESNKTTRDLIDFIKSLADGGVIVVIDEMDLVLQGRGGQGDGNVTAEIIQQLLVFFGSTEYKGDVILIGISNFPKRLDGAILDRLPVRYLFAKHEEEATAYMVALRLNQIIRNYQKNGEKLNLKGGIEKLSKLWYEKQPNLSGRPLIDSIDGVIRIAEAFNNGVVDKPIIETYLSKLNIGETSEKIEDMEMQAKELATFIPSFKGYGELSKSYLKKGQKIEEIIIPDFDSDLKDL